MGSLPADFGGRLLFILQKYGPSLLNGALTTLIIAVVGTLIGCIIGFIVGIIQTIPVEKNDNPVKKVVLWIVRLILNIYVEVFRGTPMMVQAVFIYYGSLTVFGIDMSSGLRRSYRIDQYRRLHGRDSARRHSVN
jgi:His/Glu/Gln/Arg/opine family amino acid ABC transporter permease subunit